MRYGSTSPYADLRGTYEERANFVEGMTVRGYLDAVAHLHSGRFLAPELMDLHYLNPRVPEERGALSDNFVITSTMVEDSNADRQGGQPGRFKIEYRGL